MIRKVLTAAACVIGVFAIQAQGPALAEGKVKPPVTGSATQITQTSAVLSGTFYPGTNFASMAWGLTSGSYSANCGPVTPSGTQSCKAQSLQCGMVYYYIATTNNAGKGAQKSFKTLPCG